MDLRQTLRLRKVEQGGATKAEKEFERVIPERAKEAKRQNNPEVELRPYEEVQQKKELWPYEKVQQEQELPLLRPEALELPEAEELQQQLNESEQK